MKPLQANIKKFLKSNKIATVCFIDQENKPYCINCFYFFDENGPVLIFKSSAATAHHEFIKPVACVSGTILPNSMDFLKIQGIQFSGKIMDAQEIEALDLNFKYIKAFPMSIAIPGYIWAVKLYFLKFTDNTLGFGNKTIWDYQSS